MMNAVGTLNRNFVAVIFISTLPRNNHTFRFFLDSAAIFSLVLRKSPGVIVDVCNFYLKTYIASEVKPAVSLAILSENYANKDTFLFSLLIVCHCRLLLRLLNN